jgi:osmotically-inducible protein OsmY
MSEWDSAQTLSLARRKLPLSLIQKVPMKTDSQLQQDVLAELKWEPSVHAAEIGVEVKDGIVTLAGHVGSYSEKWDAERAAQRVSGVKALAVEMDVKLLGTSQRTDADIARSAESSLQWTTFLAKDAIKIKVEKGWVTLSGQVEWQYQRESAANAVRYLMGVTGVSDDITIKPKVSSGAVKTDIEAALKRRATADAHKIKVDVKGADVTLTGTVSSWAERELANHSAWGTPGVHSVVDKMTMTY